MGKKKKKRKANPINRRATLNSASAGRSLRRHSGGKRSHVSTLSRMRTGSMPEEWRFTGFSGLSLVDVYTFQINLTAITDEKEDRQWMIIGYKNSKKNAIALIESGTTFHDGIDSMEEFIPDTEVRYVLIRMESQTEK